MGEDCACPAKSWSRAVSNDGAWVWQSGKLWHTEALRAKALGLARAPHAGRFVTGVYADQNRAPLPRRCLLELVANLSDDAVGVNVGAGQTTLGRLVNLELADGPNVHIVGYGLELPFRDESVDLIVAQEVLEHVPKFWLFVDEIRRVLKPNGRFFCQVPFQIGFHPGPVDLWRFSKQGLESLFPRPEWEIEELGITRGFGSGFYRIAVEFAATTMSLIGPWLYRPSKAAAALILYPLKAFDLLSPWTEERDRIAAGYYCVARKCPSEERSRG